MTRILEEYGMMIVAIIVFGAMFVFAPVFTNQVTTGITSSTSSFTTKAQAAVTSTPTVDNTTKKQPEQNFVSGTRQFLAGKIRCKE